MSDAGALHPSVLTTLERTPSILRALLEGMPVDAIEAQGPGGWSPRDVVAHLLSIHHAANVQRVKWILENDNPVVPNVDEEATLESSGMRIWPLPKLLDEYAAARAESMVWLRALAPDDFTRTGRHEVAGVIARRRRAAPHRLSRSHPHRPGRKAPVDPGRRAPGPHARRLSCRRLTTSRGTWRVWRPCSDEKMDPAALRNAPEARIPSPSPLRRAYRCADCALRIRAC